MSVNLLCWVSVDPNLRGRTVSYALPYGKRYYHENANQLRERGIYRKLSSAKIYEPQKRGHATLILFDNETSRDYNGFFLQLTNPRYSGSEFTVNSFSDHYFENRAASLIVVNTSSLLRYSFRDLFYEKWVRILDSKLPDRISRRGDIFTWEMWPVGISHLDPNRRYLKIFQYLKIDVGYGDYSAWIKYHIYLYLDQNGVLRGKGARWAYWIEGGAKTDDIENELRPAVISGYDLLTMGVNAVLRDIFSDISWSSIHYLPGRQLGYDPQNVFFGNTVDDVTIVLELF